MFPNLDHQSPNFRRVMQYVRLAQPGTQQTWMSPLREEPSLSELCCLLEQAEVRIPALNDSQIYGLIQVVLAFTYAVPNLYLALRWKGKLTICRRSGWNQVFAILLELAIAIALTWRLVDGIHSSLSPSKLTQVSGSAAGLVGSFTILLNVFLDSQGTLSALYHLARSVLWITFVSKQTLPLVLAYTLAFLNTALTGSTRTNESILSFSSAALFDKLTFTPLDKLLHLAQENEIEKTDLADVDEEWSIQRAIGPTSPTSDGCNDDLRSIWYLMISGSSKSSLIKGVIYSLMYSAAAISQPFLLRELLISKNLCASFALFGLSFAMAVAETQMTYNLRLLGTGTRTNLTVRIYTQSVTLGFHGLAPAIEPSVLVEADTRNIYDWFSNASLIWVIPLEVVLSLGGLVYLAGWKDICLGCTLMLFFLLPWNLAARKLQIVVVDYMRAKSSRVEYVRQVLSQVRTIKLRGWEREFESKINDKRKEEVGQLARIAVGNAILSSNSTLMPSAFAFLVFGFAILFGSSLSSEAVFPALTLFAILADNLNRLPTAALVYYAAKVSTTRLADFLAPVEDRNGLSAQVAPQTRIEVKSIVLRWSGNVPNDQPFFDSITFAAEKGQLAGLTGPVGGGKTTILKLISGSISPTSGSIQKPARTAYMPQGAILFNDTVRNNITFGKSFDARLYSRVINTCCLIKDFECLPDGDETFLGGTETTLSGGQIARISLARTLYTESDAYLLDDPLAAIDPEVQQLIAFNLFGPSGFLAESVCLVAGNSKSLLAYADKTYVVGDSKIVHKHMIKSSLDDSLSLLPSKISAQGDGMKAKEPPIEQVGPNTLKMPVPSSVSGVEVIDEMTPLLKVTSSVSQALSGPEATVPLTTQAEMAGRMDTGYTKYLEILLFATGPGWLLTIGLNVLINLTGMYSVYFLKLLVDNSGGEVVRHLAIFAGLSLAQAVLSFSFVIVVFRYCLVPMCTKVHDRMSRAVMRSKFSFFDTVPLGQIINRFSNDIEHIDSGLPGNLLNLFMVTMTTLLTFGLIAVSSPPSILYLVPIGVAYLKIQEYYIRALRGIRHVSAASRSPILNSLSEAISSGEVIVSLNQRSFFFKRYLFEVNESLKAWVPEQTSQLWLLIRLQSLGSVILLLQSVTFVMMNVPASTMGFAMTYVIRVTVALSKSVVYRVGLESDLVSVDRILSLMSNEAEGLQNKTSEVSASWPEQGSIVFHQYSARYRDGVPLALHKLNLDIKGGERVAVIGRTGAGKSSLALALLRTFEAAHGSIVVDGRDIATVELDVLRSRIAIIPQKAEIMKGTLRENLDPSGMHPDYELRSIVAECKLDVALGSSEDPLEHMFSEGGSTNSVGQLQLVALARAMLTHSKILILDEATASMDPDMEQLIQEVLQRVLQNRTIITIAHRLEFIMDYDKILALDAGYVAEFSSPATLWKRKDSIFRQLLVESHLDSQADQKYQ